MICVERNGVECNVYASGKTFGYRAIAESKIPKWRDATGREPYIKEIPREPNDTEMLDYLLVYCDPLREYLKQKAYPTFVKTWREAIKEEMRK